MKSAFAILFFSFIFLKSSGQNRDLKTALPDSTKKIQVVDAACGQCQLGLKANGCDLAVRIKGLSDNVGVNFIHYHGDAHGEEAEDDSRASVGAGEAVGALCRKPGS